MRRLRFLVSFFYYRDTDIAALLAQLGGKERVALFADSGAFSVKEQGAALTVEDYAAWLHRWRDEFEAYASLDVIGDSDASWENQQQLEAMDLQPLPVFHTGEDWSVLERYLERYTYVALGGMVGAYRPGPWLVKCFRLAQGRAVYHGFGLTRWGLLRDFPFYSVDSSSWGSAFRYGSVKLFDRGRWLSVRVGSREVWRHAALIRAHGVDPATIADREHYHRSHAARLSAAAWYRAEDYLRDRHGAVVMPQREAGPHIYLGGEGHPTKGVPLDLQAAAEAGPHIYLTDASDGNLVNGAEAGPLVYLSGKQEPIYHAATDDEAPEYHGGYTIKATA